MEDRRDRGGGRGRFIPVAESVKVWKERQSRRAPSFSKLSTRFPMFLLLCCASAH